MPYRKRCYRCKEFKDLEFFGKKATNKDGLQRICKDCQKIERKAYYDSHKEKEFNNHRKYEADHKDAINKNRSERRSSSPDYYRNAQEYVRNRKASDLRYLVASRIRYRIQRAISIQSAVKSMPILKLIGCSIEDFVKHLYTTMPEGYTWKSYRSGDLQIDHIIPCLCFKLSIPQHQRTCFHFTNTRLLPSSENASKVKNSFLNPSEIEAVVKARGL